jgi:hypothetical protein
VKLGITKVTGNGGHTCTRLTCKMLGFGFPMSTFVLIGLVH